MVFLSILTLFLLLIVAQASFVENIMGPNFEDELYCDQSCQVTCVLCDSACMPECLAGCSRIDSAGEFYSFRLSTAEKYCPLTTIDKANFCFISCKREYSRRDFEYQMCLMKCSRS